ncbi:Bacterial type II secretion system protein F domain protein [Roseimaritima multifibrata]|uniref:Bacterial type II secretion system protein F domain protein n=1 Tax=Roseimaritima multifibrata TaxID=1930274 RepID=A0A517M8V0_9BACT|nr:type II secretion system F family protein [Roseimaritima multifibrata]QDS91299.1 Bacterial type II secretion system protein F domain protein [Roseimaritima multifibrata]
MIPLLISLLVFVSISAVVFVMSQSVTVWAGGYPATLRSRLRDLTSGKATNNTTTASIFKQESERLWTGDNRAMTTRMIERLLEESGVETSVRTIVILAIGCGVISSALGFLFAGILGILLFPLGLPIPLFYLKFQRGRRRRKLSRQLPMVLQFLGRAVRSGQTVPAAMNSVAKAFEAPIATEFALCCDQQRLGLSRDSSLRDLGARGGVMELQMFVVALLVQSRSGGDIVSVFDNLSKTLQRRQKFEQRLQSLTAEGRMQAIVLLALPILTFLGLYFLSPDYIETLIERPMILVAAAAAQGLGTLWIKSIVRIDV